MYQDFVEKMQSSKTAAERNAVVAEMCKLFGFSFAKAYKVLGENGWQSGRKKRVDAGESTLETDDLHLIAALLKNGLRKNGKATMPVTVARQILVQNGFDCTLSTSRLRELLSQAALSLKDTKVASPYQKQRTEYPNQVHLVDPSVSLLWFAPNGEQKIIRDDQQYKNKNFLEGKEKCWRYVLTDHYSSSICVRYYASKGENSAHLYDFLLYCWGQKQTPSFSFHGLPELLVWDAGSANTSRAVTTALKALRVETKAHLPGNPRAKGQVECANNIVETHFECLLKLESVSSIEELNASAENWAAAWNANLIEGFDSRLNRGGVRIGSRTFLWERIKTAQLRELPSADICRQIFTTGIQVRKVCGDLSITISHPKVKRPLRYSLSGLYGVIVGQEVNVQPILVDDVARVKVSLTVDGEVASYEVEPIPYDDAGFEVNAALIGSEYKKHADTVREDNAAMIETKISGDDGDLKKLKAHSLIDATQPFITQRTGEQVKLTANTIAVTEVYISYVEACKKFKARAGILPEGFMVWLKKEYPQGVTLKIIDDLAFEYNAGTSVAKFA
ncbi:MAG: transposase [Treponemataceae bacterium]